jgi:hypothetical protein
MPVDAFAGGLRVRKPDHWWLWVPDQRSPARLSGTTIDFNSQTDGHGFAISQRVAPEVCYQHSALSVRGREEAGRPMRPIAACAGVVGRTHTRSSGHTGNHPALPAQWFTAYSVLSPATGLFCHRHLARLLARLDASVGASGPHVFAVRLRAVRQERIGVHRFPAPRP